MSETKHTPGPWDVQNKGTLGCRSARHEVVAGINRDGSKNLPTIVRMPDLSEASYANAAFIVRACNAHDDLLAACKSLFSDVLAVVEALSEIDGPCCEFPTSNTRIVLAQTWEAIAKAEGKTPQAPA